MNTVSGRNPSVCKFVKGVMLSAVQFQYLPRAAVSAQEKKSSRGSVDVREDNSRAESFLILSKCEFLLITWDYSGFATRTLGFAKLVYQRFFLPLSAC